MKNIHDDIERVLFTSEELVKRAEEIGRQITQDYKGEEVTVIGILKAIGYDVPVSIPKRYRRHFDIMNGDCNFS